MKHNSPLQRHVFLPLTCRILKSNHIFFPFLSWLTKGTRSYKALPEKHKDDLRWSRDTRNPYKCMNVIKQNAIDDKIIERCKTCEKQCIQEGLDRSRNCRAAIKLAKSTWNYLDRSRYVLRIYREATQKSRWIKNLSRMYQADKEHRNLAQWIDLVVEKLSRSNPEISIKEICVELLSKCCQKGIE